MNTVGRLKAVLGLDDKKFRRGLKNSSKQASQFGSRMKKIGATVAGALSVGALIQGTRKMISTYASFSQQISRLSALTGKSKKQLKGLTDQAKELGSTTQKSASQVASLQNELAKKGFSTGEIGAATEGIVNLSIAAGEDLASSASLASGVMNAFGMEAEEVGRITDVMAESFASTSLDLNKFQLGMSKVAPVAKQLGVSLEKTTGMLGTLVDANVEAGTASAQLRNIMLKSRKQGLSMAQAFKQIRNASDPSTEAMSLFGVEAASVATILANNTAKSSKLAKQFENVDGAAKEMADTFADSVQGDLDAAQSAVEGLFIEIGTSNNDGIRGAIQGFVEMVRGATENVDGFIAKAKATLKVVGVLTASFLAAKTAIIAYNTYMKAAQIAMLAYRKGAQLARIAQLGFNAAMRANPIGIIITALTALGTAFITAYKTSDKFRARVIYVAKETAYRFKFAWAAIKVGVKNLFAVVEQYFKSIGDSAKVLWKAVKAVFTSGKSPGEVLRDGFAGIKKDLGDLGKDLGKQIKEEMGDAAKPDYDEILNAEQAKKKAKDTGKEAGKEMAKGIADGVASGGGGGAVGGGGGGVGGGRDTSTPGGKMEGRGITGFETEKIEPQLANMDKFMEKNRQIGESLKQSGQQGNIMSGILGNAFDGMQNSISDALKNSENVLQGFWQFFKNFVKSLIIKLVAAAVAAAALVALLSMTGLNIGGFTSASSFGDIMGGLSGLGGGGANMANGGIVPSGYPNDSYPAMLSSGETVTPPKKLPDPKSGGMGGELKARVSGQDLEFVLDKWGKNKNRIT